MLVAGGSTNVTTYFALRLSADGTAATALTITNFDLQYVRSGAAPSAKVDATALAATDSAHGDNQAIEIDATDQPGLYRVDWPDAAFAAGVREVILTVKCATCFTEHLRVEIDGEVNVVEWAGTDVVAGAIPAAAADAAGGLPISDAGGLDLDAKLANTNEVTAARMGALTDWIDGGRLDLIIDAILNDTDLIDDATSGLAKIATDVAAVLVDTAVIGAAGAGLTALPWNAAWDAEVQSEVNDALVAFFTSAAALVDLIWNEATAGHVGAGSTGKALVDVLADTNELQTDDVPGLIAALNDISAADILTTALTESYAADGAAGTLTQILYLIQQTLTEFAIASTTKTVKKLDGSTTAATLTLDDDTNPTSLTRAT